MKKIKRVLTLCLAVAMMLTLCSCQANTNKKFFEILGEANSFKTGSFSTEVLVETKVEDDVIDGLKETFGVTINDNKMQFKLKVDGQIDSDKNELNGKIAVALDDTYTDLTTVVMKNDKIYVNVHQLVNSLLNMKVIKDALVSEGSDELYAQILDNTNQLFQGKEFIVLEPTDAQVENFNFNSYMTIVKDSDFYKNLWTLIKDTITGFEPAVINKEKGVYTMTLTSDHLNTVNTKTEEFVKANGELVYNVIHNVATANDNQLAMMVFSMVEESFYGDFNDFPTTSEDAVKLIEENKTAIVEGIQNSTATPKESTEQVNGVLTIAVSKEKDTINVNMGVKDEDTTMQIVNKVTSGTVTIEAPTNAITLEELMTSVMSNDFFGAIMGEMGNVGMDDDDDYSYPGDEDPTIIGDDEWKYEEDIDVDSIENKSIAEGVKKYMAVFNANGYQNVQTNYNYGSYEVVGNNGENSVSAEFDVNYGDKDHGYLYRTSLTVTSDTATAEMDDMLETTAIKFEDIFEMQVPLENVKREFEDPDSEYMTGYYRVTVYNPDGSNFNVGYDTNEDYEFFNPECTISYYFE